jgi:putative ABC transport system substrate-binding protein
MRRRDFISLLGSAAGALPLALHAQQEVMPAIGYLSSFSPPPNLSDLGGDPFHQGLSETGYVEGQNVAFEYRWAEGHYDRLPALAADLVGRRVDLIKTAGGTSAALAAKSATSTIPIVFTNVGEPVGIGLVASLARPGGNVTGVGNISLELTPKRLELLSELVPQPGVIALLVNPTNAAYTDSMIPVVQEAPRPRTDCVSDLRVIYSAENLRSAVIQNGRLNVGVELVKPFIRPSADKGSTILR